MFWTRALAAHLPAQVCRRQDSRQHRLSGPSTCWWRGCDQPFGFLSQQTNDGLLKLDISSYSGKRGDKQGRTFGIESVAGCCLAG